MASCKKILLAGFSGAGKSTLLEELKLSASSEWEHFDDLDRLVLKNRGKKHPNLASLINEAGWETFRLWERQELEGWLKLEEPGVLALGGGTLSPMIWELYRNSRKILFCHLYADFEICWQRLMNSSDFRPLATQGKEHLETIYQQRMGIFKKIPWQLENNDQSDIKDLASEFWEHYLRV
jgi:shikimate kinase